MARELQLVVSGVTEVPAIYLTNQRWFHSELISQERLRLSCQQVGEDKCLCTLQGGEDKLLLGHQVMAFSGVANYYFLQEIEILLPPVAGEKQRGRFFQLNLAQISQKQEIQIP